MLTNIGVNRGRARTERPAPPLRIEVHQSLRSVQSVNIPDKNVINLPDATYTTK